MEINKVHLFVILLLALVLCSFLGGNCGTGLEGFANANANANTNNQYSSYANMYRNITTPVRNVVVDDVTTSKYSPYPKNSTNYNLKYKKLNGVRANQILPGQEHLYILKSEVIPPVCPACPSVKCKSNGSKSETAEKCPPCPPCARCPEPAFDCKKVPNYNRVNDGSMPYPVLNDFSQFGL